jgi:hypothetical protein
MLHQGRMIFFVKKESDDALLDFFKVAVWERGCGRGSPAATLINVW